jgi:drug/metabolite transporter (DMT)-like permease
VSVRNSLALAGALAGMALVTLSHPGESALTGNLLAIAAAILASLFSLAARRLRQDTSVIPFVLIVNWSGALFLGLLGLIFGISLGGYTQSTWTGLIMLGLIPTLIGHSLLTYSIGHMPAFVVNASILGEPVGASILAAIFLHEFPSLQTILGGAVIVVCILLIIFERSVPEPVPETT